MFEYRSPADEIIPNLFLGSIFAGWNSDYLRKNRVRSVLQVCPTLQQTPKSPSNIERWTIPVDDIPETDLLHYFPYTTHWIHYQLHSGRKTLIHCMAGVSRSATILSAYLMVRYRWSTQQTIQYIRQRRPIIQPNPGFIKQLQLWEIYLQQHPNLYLNP